MIVLCRWMALLLVLVLVLAGCGNTDKDAASPADGMTMRVYSVPTDRAAALVDSLNQALAPAKDQALGKVSLGADGQIIVLAPDSLHPSIEKSLQQIVGAAPQDAVNPRPQLRLRMWSVDALPGDGEDSSGLNAVAEVLDELRKSRGPVHFELRDEIESVSTDQERVKRTWGKRARMRNPQALDYLIYLVAGKRVLSFSFLDSNYVHPEEMTSTSQMISTKIDTTTSINLGQTLVLASQPVAGDDEGARASTRYYIVRIDELGAD